jgi:hypothetical protein
VPGGLRDQWAVQTGVQTSPAIKPAEAASLTTGKWAGEIGSGETGEIGVVWRANKAPGGRYTPRWEVSDDSRYLVLDFIRHLADFRWRLVLAQSGGIAAVWTFQLDLLCFDRPLGLGRFWRADPLMSDDEAPGENQTPRKPRRQAAGAEDRQVVYRGATVNQLADMFGMRDETVYRRIAGIEPSGTGKNGVLIYRVADVAPRLIRVPITAEMVREHIVRMKPSDLPPSLQKAYWDGALARHRYSQIAGELWQTQEVLASAVNAFQTLRQELLLLPDQLRGEIDLDDKQTSIVQQFVDGLIEGLRERLIANLRADSGAGPAALPAPANGQVSEPG